MKTISQVARLTGISVRTLQYYDEIDLLKPSQVTSSGYRLYDDDALERLQQILFFKELDFKLKDIRKILETPDFDKTAAYQKQRKLLCLKRSRLDSLIALLEKLEKGEQCMSFKEFSLKEYLEALEEFKTNKSDEVIKHWGSMEKFNEFIQKIRDDESKLIPLAQKEFGSVEKFTAAMKHNLEHFSEIMEQIEEVKANGGIEKAQRETDALYLRLTADMSRDVSSEEVQSIVREMVESARESQRKFGMELPDGTWDFIIEGYTHDKVREFTDDKYGEGAARYIADALSCFFHKPTGE